MRNHLLSTIIVSFLSTFLVLGLTALLSIIVLSSSTTGTASGSSLPNKASNFNVNKSGTANDLVTKGVALAHLGKFNEAISLYDKALAIKPNLVNALNAKGLALDSLGKFNEAIGMYDRALAVDPNNTAALTNKGVTLYHLGRYNEAISLYDKVSTIDPNNTAALTNKNIVIASNRTK